MALVGKGKKPQKIIAQGLEENWDSRYSGIAAKVFVRLLLKGVLI